MLNWPIIKHIISNTDKFCIISTNGSLVKQEHLDFLASHRNNAKIVISFGDAYQYFSGVKEKLASMPHILEHARKYPDKTEGFLSVTNPDNMVEDFHLLTECFPGAHGYPGANVDYTRFKTFTDEYVTKWVAGWKILLEEGLPWKTESPDCGAGTQVMLCDTDGSLWSCDFWRDLGMPSIGNVFDGIFPEGWRKATEPITAPREEFVKCRECEIDKICEHRCSAWFQSLTGDPYTACDPFCRMQKEIARVVGGYNKVHHRIERKVTV
jgi:radical SAM protein with 4Fe4S-binding SPASM domain